MYFKKSFRTPFSYSGEKSVLILLEVFAKLFIIQKTNIDAMIYKIFNNIFRFQIRFLSRYRFFEMTQSDN